MRILFEEYGGTSITFILASGIIFALGYVLTSILSGDFQFESIVMQWLVS